MNLTLERVITLVIVAAFIAISVNSLMKVSEPTMAATGMIVYEDLWAVIVPAALVELGSVFFSLLLVAYVAWRYLKRREKHLLYLTLSLAFLTLALLFQMVILPISIYYIDVKVRQLLELGSLALFACFTIFTMLALKKT